MQQRVVWASSGPESAPTSDDAAPAGHKRPRVVVAEDAVLIQEHIKSLLKADCDIVGAAEDGPSALAVIRDQQPDILLIDVSLPDMNGFAVAEKLNAIGSPVRIIFVTAHRDKQYANRAFEIGAKGYVLKGAIASELLAAVRAVVAGSTYRSPLLP
jgi:DNA-binding NarL/FixJ family response regulator